MDEKNYWVNKNPGSRGGSAAKTPKVRETQVQPLGQEDPHLEKEMAALCCILASRTPWTEEPGGLQSMGWQSVKHN